MKITFCCCALFFCEPIWKYDSRPKIYRDSKLIAVEKCFISSRIQWQLSVLRLSEALMQESIWNFNKKIENITNNTQLQTSKTDFEGLYVITNSLDLL